ncbi:hypothetical protein [Pontivivens insulae]|uniref:Uncharacterized protein n=1 Tax=Pontivivens insulae TaxID=1639689 RepID=A0A2R8ABS4_9RHOB|nr:hypothetical protein [Pontivivens insulae]RED11126.1 hypothetical protein DFR53_3156 [Pontivivens insulae]SPF29699.1 hypothetical protein POI8812_02015 [Pontivivens insulae]
MQYHKIMGVAVWLASGGALAAECSDVDAAEKSLDALIALQDFAELEPQRAQQLAAEMQAEVNAAMIRAGNAPSAEVCAIYDETILELAPQGRIAGPVPAG